MRRVELTEPALLIRIPSSSMNGRMSEQALAAIRIALSGT